MAHRQKPVHQSALPLSRRLNDGSFTRSGISESLKLENVQNVTNWLARGVPGRRMPALARLFGLTVDEYLHEAGMLGKGPRDKKSGSATSHLENYQALPPILQEYIKRKTADLRSMYDNIPAWLRDTLGPPKDAKGYAAWEKSIEDMVQKFRAKH